jgi:hypothetical protein
VTRPRAPALAALLALAACEPAPAAGSCPDDLPPACPAPAPSYQAQVAPLLEARCVGCHGAGQVASNRLLDSYGSVFPQRAAVLRQTYACQMPPADAGAPLTLAERAALLGWLVCGAPDN